MTHTAIIRKEIDPFTIVPNQVLNSLEISLAAKGMYAYMKSKPDNWNFTIRSMAKQLKEGQTAISSAVKELRACGLVSYQKQNDGTGIYFVHASIPDENPKPENPDQAFPMLGKPKRISKTDLSSKKEGSEYMSDEVEQAFNLFWSAGLKKASKPSGQKAFLAAIKRHKIADVQAFAQKLHDDIAARKRIGTQLGFDALMPSTYLNNDRWEDDLPVPAAQQQSPQAGSDRWWISDAGIERKARLEGVAIRSGETYRDLADRLRVLEQQGQLKSQQSAAQQHAVPVENTIKNIDIPF